VIHALRLLLLFPLFGAAPTVRDVRWLAEVATPPKSFPAKPAGKLRPLLVDAGGKPIHTLAGWKTRRRELRTAWMKFLGPMPARRPPVKLTVLRTDKLKGLTRQLVQYESEPGVKVEGYLLRPTRDPRDFRKSLGSGGKRPALVALHATTRDTIDQIAGVKGNKSRQIGLQLARRGFVVFCPRCFLWQSVTNYKDAVANFHKRHPKTLGMRKMLYDAMRGVDVLESLPYVDANRIGAVGHSLGAKETLYLAAFDERIKVAVASEGGIGFRFTNWDAPWYLGKGIHEPKFPRNHHELLALIAPRSFLILSGEKGRGAADGERTWPYLVAAQKVYRLYGGPVRLGMYNHRAGHDIPPKAFSRLAEWLETYLNAIGG
jgi:Dienelactone hydrolase family